MTLAVERKTTTGANLRDCRVDVGASQTAVGLAMGVSRARIVVIEGQAVVGGVTADRYLNALATVTVDESARRVTAVFGHLEEAAR